MTSEAYFLTKYGSADKAFELREFEISTPEKNQVLIEVESFGLNYADVMARNKLYKAAPPLPCVLGYEVVGKIISVGDENNSELIGQKVVAFTRFGGYAKHAFANIGTFVKIDELTNYRALSLATQYVTAFYMCEYLSPIHENDTILIHAAAGGVGSALIQLCKLKKAIVIAKVSSENKINYTKNLGADFSINYNEKDYIEALNEILKGRKIDVSFNPVAGSTFKKDMKMLSAGGKIILFGGSERSGKKWGILSSLNFVRKMGLTIPIGLMMQSKNILGVNMLTIADEKPQILTHCLQSVLKLLQENKISITQGKEFDSKHLSEAHSLLQSGNSIGKIIINW